MMKTVLLAVFFAQTWGSYIRSRGPENASIDPVVHDAPDSPYNIELHHTIKTLKANAEFLRASTAFDCEKNSICAASFGLGLTYTRSQFKQD